MKNLYRNLLVVLFACYTFISCSQNVPTAKATVNQQATTPVTAHLFDVNGRDGGAAFYSMNSQTGEISYMLDFGEDAGKWFNYGSAIRESGSNPLLFKAIEGEKGTTIYAMDSGSGQMYYLLDHGNNPGQWNQFGNRIRENALNMLQLDIVDKGDGNITFYAYDNYTHQTYFMNLVGENAIKWAKYGTPYKAEEK